MLLDRGNTPTPTSTSTDRNKAPTPPLSTISVENSSKTTVRPKNLLVGSDITVRINCIYCVNILLEKFIHF